VKGEPPNAKALWERFHGDKLGPAEKSVKVIFRSRWHQLITDVGREQPRDASKSRAVNIHEQGSNRRAVTVNCQPVFSFGR
jgi:hypothetical protein